MQISKTLVTLINKQITHELTNSHMYRGLAIYFESNNFHGFGKWMTHQTNDELTHAQKFIDHLLDRKAKIEIGALPPAKTDFPDILAAFKTALQTEEKTSALIYGLFNQAVKDEDYAAQSLLKWFVDEQVEEEKWANEIVDLIEDVGLEHKGGIYMLDHRWPKQAGGES